MLALLTWLVVMPCQPTNQPCIVLPLGWAAPPHLAVNDVVVPAVLRPRLLLLRLGRGVHLAHHRPHLVVALWGREGGAGLWAEGGEGLGVASVQSRAGRRVSCAMGLGHACIRSRRAAPCRRALPARLHPAQGRANGTPCSPLLGSSHLRGLHLQRQGPVVVLNGALGQVLQAVAQAKRGGG